MEPEFLNKEALDLAADATLLFDQMQACFKGNNLLIIRTALLIGLCELVAMSKGVESVEGIKRELDLMWVMRSQTLAGDN